METWRIIIIVILMVLSSIDLGATYYYVKTYKNWQPSKPYNLIEQNPLLVLLWNTFGLNLGMIIGSILILSLIYIIGKSAHWVVILIVGLFLVYALFNHWTNINLLHELINKYPSGHLPKETFGKVIGNN